MSIVFLRENIKKFFIALDKCENNCYNVSILSKIEVRMTRVVSVASFRRVLPT